MNYITHSLGRNEKLMASARFHWVFRFFGFLVLMVMLGLLVAFTSYAGYQSFFEQIVIAAIAFIGFISFFAIMLPLWTTEIGVTNHRLILKTGWISRKTEEIQLTAVEEVNLEQSILGRILGFGNITVCGTGVDDIHLRKLEDPVTFRRAIEEAAATRNNK